MKTKTQSSFVIIKAKTWNEVQEVMENTVVYVFQNSTVLQFSSYINTT